MSATSDRIDELRDALATTGATFVDLPEVVPDGTHPIEADLVEVDLAPLLAGVDGDRAADAFNRRFADDGALERASERGVVITLVTQSSSAGVAMAIASGHVRHPLAAIDGGLAPALSHLRDALSDKSAALDGIVKTGRTHLQDATPIRLGQIFGGYFRQVTIASAELERALDGLCELPLGGTAVGTGINAHP